MRAQSALSLLLAAGALAGEVAVNRDGAIDKRGSSYDCSPDDSSCCAYYDICDGEGYVPDAYYSEIAYYESIYYEELSSLYNDGYFTDEIPSFNPTEFDNPSAIASEESALESVFANPTFSEALGGGGGGFTAFTPLITPAPTGQNGGGSGGSQPSAAQSNGAPAATTPASGGSSSGGSGGNPLSGGGNGAAADLRIPTMASLLLGGALVAVMLL